MQKQQLNVYTVMLMVAFFAIATASLLLYLELSRWGSFPWWQAEAGGGAVSYVDPHATLELYHPVASPPREWS